jgi:hypothetical protein
MRRNHMKTSYKTLTATFGALALTLLLAPNANAGCGGIGQPLPSHSSWHSQLGQGGVLPAALVTISDNGAGIVGFWHVKFFAHDSPGTPEGAEVDAGYSQWHSDGTEIMNSGGHSPLNSNFCLGVWKQVSTYQYKLNHFATFWDSTTNLLVGPARVQEEVTLNPDGNQFTGTFTIDQYDESGNSLAHLQGVIKGTRIDVNTPAQSIF